MASGFFPIDKYDENYQELKNMTERLRTLAQEFQELSAEHCVPEDAVTDGMSIQDFLSSTELIERNLK